MLKKLRLIEFVEYFRKLEVVYLRVTQIIKKFNVKEIYNS